MDKPIGPSREDLEQMMTDLVRQAESNTARWDGDKCPVCRADLKLPPEVAALPGAVFLRLGEQLGMCPSCGLSPREVSEDEIARWVWVQVPSRVDLASLSRGNPVRASGATIGEVLDDVERQHPGVRARMWLDHERVRPRLRLRVNREAVLTMGDLDTAISRGDFLEILLPF